MKLYYMAHPVSGDVAGNLARAKRWLKWLYKEYTDWGIIAPWLEIVEYSGLDNNNLEDLLRGLEIDKETVARCDGIILVGGQISRGMHMELEVAKQHGLHIEDLTKLGPEPPE